jgi:hypothetical protein
MMAFGRRARRLLLAAVVLAGAALFALAAGMIRRQQAVLGVRDQLALLRTSVDSCQAALPAEASVFEAFGQRADSLRARVRALEAIDPRGVPADSYRVYLDALERYNRTVDGWEPRADSLRARWDRCRDLTERHNLLADSLRRLAAPGRRR